MRRWPDPKPGLRRTQRRTQPALTLTGGPFVSRSFCPYGKFEFTAYAVRTVLTAAGATATWWAVTRLSSRPKWLMTRLAALATALFLTPDFLLLGIPGNPTGPVVIIMLMHLALAVITYAALIKVAPRRGAPR